MDTINYTCNKKIKERKKTKVPEDDALKDHERPLTLSGGWGVMDGYDNIINICRIGRRDCKGVDTL